MKYKLLVGIALLSLSALEGRLARLPDHFYMIGKDKNPSLFDPSKQQHHIILIVVPAAAESAKKDTNATKSLMAFTDNNKIQVPASFFSLNSPRFTTSPMCVYFDWQDTSPSTNQLTTPARKLAEGLDYLNSLNSTCIVITQGRGGLVFNAATQSMKHPVSTVIQLGTPIPKDTKKYANFIPQTSKINQLYTFYSQQPFTFSKPTLHPRYTHSYTNLNHPNNYSVLSLINNRQPQQTELYGRLVGKNIFNVCFNIKQHFKVNKDLFASLNSLKKDTNNIVAIRKPVNKKSPQRTQEVMYSNDQKKILYATWKRAPELNLSTGARMRSLHRFKKA